MIGPHQLNGLFINKTGPSDQAHIKNRNVQPIAGTGNIRARTVCFGWAPYNGPLTSCEANLIGPYLDLAHLLSLWAIELGPLELNYHNAQPVSRRTFDRSMFLSKGSINSKLTSSIINNGPIGSERCLRRKPHEWASVFMGPMACNPRPIIRMGHEML